MASDFHPPALHKSKNLGQWLLLGVVLLTLGVVMAGGQWRDYVAASDAERAQLRTQVRVLDESLTAQIQSADAALRTMLQSMVRWRGPNGYLPFAHEHLQRVAHMMPGTRTFAVTDSNGICQLSNRTELLGQDFSSRDYFKQAAADKTGALLHIAPPFQSVLNVWSVTLSRTIVRPNGEFGGVVTATLSPVYFEALMKNLQYAPDLRTTLVHDQGQVYVTSLPNLPFQQGNRLTTRSFLNDHLASNLPESDVVGPGVSGKPTMAVTRTVNLQGLHATHSFVAVASRETSAIYASWRAMCIALVSIWLAMAALSSWGLLRHQRSGTRLAAKVAAARQALRLSHQRFEQLAQTIPCMLFHFDVTDQNHPGLTYVGPYSQTLLGVAPEVLMADYTLLFRMVHPEDRAGLITVFQDAISKRQDYDHEFRLTTDTGEQRWLKTTATSVALQNNPDVTHLSGFLFDITENKTRQLQLKQMAYQDPLTQADNRRSFMEKLKNELARVERYGEEAALLMLDIDFFKRVNDTYGHVVGDTVLKHLVAVLYEGLRGVDSLGRLGGEEFAVLLPGTSLEAAVQLAERLRLAVQASPALQAGQTVPFTISLGVASITADVTDVKTALHLADKAMYRAKQTGRNRVCTADEAPPTTLQGSLD